MPEASPAAEFQPEPPAAPRRSWLRMVLRFLGMLLLNAVLIPAYALCLGPLRRFRRPLQVQWCRGSCWLCGFRLRVEGTPRNSGPTLFVANHCSYIDIPVIARDAHATFVAKASVAQWPLFGLAARLTGTIFVQRVGSEAKLQSKQLLDRLSTGENLMLFAEGTSTDGSGVAPFKSTLFAIAEQAPPGIGLAVQPVALTYARARDGTPLIGPLRALYCWYGDALMLPHLLRLLSLRGAEVELRFLEPLPVEGVRRKELARRAHAAVAAGVADANARLLGPAVTSREAAVLSAAPPAAAGAAGRSAPAAR